jgi:hypothetical protein
MEKEMRRDDESVNGIAEALEKLNAKLDDAVVGGRRRRGRDSEEEVPRSVSSLERGRKHLLEIQGVLFQIRVPIGRRRDAMPSVQAGAPSRT